MRSRRYSILDVRVKISQGDMASYLKCTFDRIFLIFVFMYLVASSRGVVNPIAVMRELRKEADKMYENSWEREYAIEKFMEGAESLFNLLLTHNV